MTPMPRIAVQAVVQGALWRPAASRVCGHHPPATDCQPSKEDRAITTRLVEAGKLLGIAVLDHLIISGTGKCLSFADEGLLERG